MCCQAIFRLYRIICLKYCCSEIDYNKEKLYLKTIKSRPQHTKNSIIYVNDYPDFKYHVADNLKFDAKVIENYSTELDGLFNMLYNYEQIDVYQINRHYSKIYTKILCCSFLAY